MRRDLPALALLLSMTVLGVAPTADAQETAGPTFETVWIPMTEKSPPGAPRELRLEGMLYRPPLPGRLPVLVFNHGSTGWGRVAPTATEWYHIPKSRASSWSVAGRS